MKAARLEDGTLHIRDVDIPVPGNDEALVRISASGVCHSDLHIVRGDWSGIPSSGVVGHEAIGVVHALGPGAERFVAVGDRVSLGRGGTRGG
jgi:D-arabinose 1-dehydrogenase-like Zn-dependent alcohol dehydrogenase